MQKFFCFFFLAVFFYLFCDTGSYNENKTIFCSNYASKWNFRELRQKGKWYVNTPFPNLKKKQLLMVFGDYKATLQTDAVLPTGRTKTKSWLETSETAICSF